MWWIELLLVINGAFTLGRPIVCEKMVPVFVEGVRKNIWLVTGFCRTFFLLWQPGAKCHKWLEPVFPQAVAPASWRQLKRLCNTVARPTFAVTVITVCLPGSGRDPLFDSGCVRACCCCLRVALMFVLAEFSALLHVPFESGIIRHWHISFPSFHRSGAHMLVHTVCPARPCQPPHASKHTWWRLEHIYFHFTRCFLSLFHACIATLDIKVQIFQPGLYPTYSPQSPWACVRMDQVITRAVPPIVTSERHCTVT